MIKVENCIGCGRLILVQPIANLAVRLDPEPVTADQAVQSLMGGQQLWRVTPASVTGARPEHLAALRQGGTVEEGRIHQEHRCTARGATNTRPSVSQVTATPHRPSAGRTETPYSGRPTAHSSAPTADSRRTDSGNPRCPDCGLTMGDGEYVAIQIGELYHWAAHLTGCTAA